MIEKLRKRVIALTMIAVFIALLVLMGIVNVANFVSTNNRIDELLDLLEENGGTFAVFGKEGHGGMPGGQGGMFNGQGGMFDGQGGTTGGQSGMPDGQGGMFDGQGGTTDGQGGMPDGGFDDDFEHEGLRPGMTEETPYETRFFSVALDDETGEMIYIDTARIAAISQTDAVALAQSIPESKKITAYVQNGESIYKYRAVSPAPAQTNIFGNIQSGGMIQGPPEIPTNSSQSSDSTDATVNNSDDTSDASSDVIEGSTLYIFVDATRQLHSLEDFMLISLLVSLGGLVAIGALVFALSPTMVRPIAESYEKQKKFITNAGHELKTPMAVIKSCNEVIELENGSSKWTQAITEQVDKLTDLTGKLVALAKMDEASDMSGVAAGTGAGAGARAGASTGAGAGTLGSDGLLMEDFDLGALLAETLRPFSLVAEQMGLDFKCDIDGAEVFGGTSGEAAIPSINFRGNRASITELINILADNAIKYCAVGDASTSDTSIRDASINNTSSSDVSTSDDSIRDDSTSDAKTPYIKFNLYKSGNKVILSEENPADNLTKGNQKQFFDRFYRGDQSHSSSKSNGTSVAGFGIGLSMAQSIVSAHGGTIDAESPDGKRLIITAKL